MFTGLINLNFTLPKPSSSTGAMWYAAAPLALLMFASVVYSISSKKKKEGNIGTDARVSTDIVEAATASFQRSDEEEISWKSASDVLFEEDNILDDDAKYAEELQVQEALFASMLTTNIKASTSTTTPHHRSSSSLSSLLMVKKKEEEIQQVLCNICLEKQEYWQMFRNSTCCHSFCYDCTTKHATTKIQEKYKTISCPGINCKSTLDFNPLRQIITKETLIMWDEFLCESMILESPHKLYCPFANCSVLLINDDASITKIDCPVCHRSFCAVCRVPWHSEFSCKEFGKLIKTCKRNRGKKHDDDMTLALAKKKKWKKCPKCNFFVEKAEGCVHITCRCKYEFCYDCGAKWSSTHGGCSRSRSSSQAAQGASLNIDCGGD